MFVAMREKTRKTSRTKSNKAKRLEILKEPTLLDCQATIADTSNDIHVLTSSPCQNSGNFTVNNTSCHRVITALRSTPW